jgi:PAS domain S-box-containing protein
LNLKAKNGSTTQIRSEKLKSNSIVRFQSLSELSKDVLPPLIIKLFEKTFHLGEVVIVKIMKGDKIYGDFTIFMSKNQTLADETTLEIYAQQVGLLLEKIKSENILATFFNTNLDLLCIADMDGRFLKLNPFWEKTLGYPVNELLGKEFITLVHPDDVKSTQVKIRSLSKQNEVTNYVNRILCKDGSYRFIEWRSKPYGNLIYGHCKGYHSRPFG